MGFAGLWETWTDRQTGEEITTCTILTCAPNPLMAELHDRMPVILDPADRSCHLQLGDSHSKRRGSSVSRSPMPPTDPSGCRST